MSPSRVRAVEAYGQEPGRGEIHQRLHGRFQNGRVEELYPNHEPLRWSDLNRVGPTHVAPIMAHFHSLQVPSSVLEQTTTTKGDIFQRVQEWMELAERLCQEDHYLSG